jgi:hypothetical protein
MWPKLPSYWATNYVLQILELRVFNNISAILRWSVLKLMERRVPSEIHQLIYLFTQSWIQFNASLVWIEFTKFVGDNLYIIRKCINIYCTYGYSYDMYRQFQQWFIDIIAVTFIGGGNHWSEFELTTLVVITTDCTCSCKSNYYMITTTAIPVVFSAL